MLSARHNEVCEPGFPSPRTPDWVRARPALADIEPAAQFFRTVLYQNINLAPVCISASSLHPMAQLLLGITVPYRELICLDRCDRRPGHWPEALRWTTRSHGSPAPSI